MGAIHGVPLLNMTIVVARKIGSLMGQVLEIDHMEGGLYWQVPASPYWGGCAAAAHARYVCGFP